MGEVAKRPSDPIKGGNLFAGWYTDDVTFTEEWDFDNAPEEDLTLYANWISIGPVQFIAVKKDPDKMTYTAFETLNLKGIVIELTYANGVTEDVPLSQFAQRNITTVPEAGTVLDITTHDQTPIIIIMDGFFENTQEITVNKATAPSVTFPTASSIIYGQALSDSVLTGVSTNGTFAWQDPAFKPSAGTGPQPVEFTPNDTVNYDYSAVSGWNPTTQKVTRNINITVTPVLITKIDLNITAPVKGVLPDTAPSGTYNCVIASDPFTYYITNSNIASVVWTPANGVFIASTVYTVTIVYSSTGGSDFAIASTVAATINGENAVTSNRTDSNVTITYTFQATDAKDIFSIAYITKPTKTSYIHGETVDLTGFSVLLLYDDGTTEDVPYNNFASKNILVQAAGNALTQGMKISHSTYDGQAITVSVGSFAPQTAGTLSVVKKPLTIASVTHTKPYDGNTSASGVVVTFNESFVTGDDVSVGTVIAAYTSENPGIKIINVTDVALIGADNGNYIINTPIPLVYTMLTGGITGGSQEFDITVESITDGNIQLNITSGIVLSRSNALSKSATISVSNAASSVKWYYDNAQIPTTGNSITLSVSNNPLENVAYNNPYNIVGTHLLTVVVTIGGVEYSKRIEFEVTL